MTLLAHNEYHSLIMLWHAALEAVSKTPSYQPSSIRNVLFLQMVNSASEVTEGCILEVSNLSLLSFSCVSLKYFLSPSLSPNFLLSSGVLHMYLSAYSCIFLRLLPHQVVLNTAPLGDEDVEIRPHSLTIHSYKTPTFCNFCGEMLFGMFKQV